MSKQGEAPASNRRRLQLPLADSPRRLELDAPIELSEGEKVVVEIHQQDKDEAWKLMGIERLEQEWDNPEDAIYDDWRRLYGVDPPVTLS